MYFVLIKATRRNLQAISFAIFYHYILSLASFPAPVPLYLLFV